MRFKYSFFVEGTPRGHGRPRHTLPTTNCPHGHTYTMPADRAYAEVIAAAARSAIGDVALEGPIGIHIRVFIARPKSRMKDRPERAIFCQKKPDGDNVEKAIWDALMPWIRDEQVTDWSGRKRYVDVGFAPGVLVWIYGLDDEDEFDKVTR